MCDTYLNVIAGVRQPAPWSAGRDAEQANDPSDSSRGDVNDGDGGGEEEEYRSCGPERRRFPALK